MSKPLLTLPRQITSFPPFYFSHRFFFGAEVDGAGRRVRGESVAARAGGRCRSLPHPAGARSRGPWSSREALQGARPPATSGRHPQGEAVAGQPGLPASGRELRPVAPLLFPDPAAAPVHQATPPVSPGRPASAGNGERGRSSAGVSWALRQLAPGDRTVLGGTYSPGRAGASRRARPAQTSSTTPPPPVSWPPIPPGLGWQPPPARTFTGSPGAAPGRAALLQLAAHMGDGLAPHKVPVASGRAEDAASPAPGAGRHQRLIC